MLQPSREPTSGFHAAAASVIDARIYSGCVNRWACQLLRVRAEGRGILSAKGRVLVLRSPSARQPFFTRFCRSAQRANRSLAVTVCSACTCEPKRLGRTAKHGKTGGGVNAFCNQDVVLRRVNCRPVGSQRLSYAIVSPPECVRGLDAFQKINTRDEAFSKPCLQDKTWPYAYGFGVRERLSRKCRRGND